MASKGAGDSWVVLKVGRLTRPIRWLPEAAERLEQCGIGLKVLTQHTDTTSAGRRLISSVFSAIAEFGREAEQVELEVIVRGGLLADLRVEALDRQGRYIYF